MDKASRARKAELKRKYGTDKALGVVYDEQEELSVLPDGGEAGRCTDCANYIIRQEGAGKIMGYGDKTNPSAKATGDFPGSGHDFAIIDDRYIVDPWVVETSGQAKRAVFDLQDPADAAEIKRLYGNPKRWAQVTPSPAPKRYNWMTS